MGEAPFPGELRAVSLLGGLRPTSYTLPLPSTRGGRRQGTMQCQGTNNGGSSVHSFCTQSHDHGLLSSQVLTGLALICPDLWSGLGTPPVQNFVHQALVL